MQAVLEERFTTEEEVDAFLRREGLVFPNDYRAFVLEINGGVLDWSTKVTLHFRGPRGRQREIVVESFWAFVAGEKYSAQPWCWMVNNSYRPRFLFEIANAGPSRKICMGLSPTLAGKIFLFDDQKTLVTPSTTEEEIFQDRGIIHIANSFTEFVDSLRRVKVD